MFPSVVLFLFHCIIFDILGGPEVVNPCKINQVLVVVSVSLSTETSVLLGAVHQVHYQKKICMCLFFSFSDVDLYMCV